VIFVIFIISGLCANVQCAKSALTKQLLLSIEVLLTKHKPCLKSTMCNIES
jgi:hypothetical protein